ncbi:unnamed protein product [Sphagnum jensenii]|uniref:Uncharacterized protein n=1 Tax=Sphagnum jensenii TaxID=128206 RepID=A0ABP0W7N7_9BRYO
MEFAASNYSRPFVIIMDFVQAEEVFSVVACQPLSPLACGCNQHLSNTRERTATSEFAVAVETSSQEEAQGRETHGDGQTTQTLSPTHVVREVNDQTDGDQNSQVYGEVEPVQEAGKLPLFPRICRVKLVGSKRGHTWFYPC